MKLKQWSLLAALAVTIPLAACGGDDSASTNSEASASSDAPATTDDAAPSEGGSLFVTGSSTVEPISIKVGELAGTAEGGNLKVTVEGPGTGDGFKKFCAGEGDITGASRAIKEEEVTLCADGGVEYIELAVAIDGLTVATSPANTAVECLDKAALYALVGPEYVGFSSWADANAIAGEWGHNPLPWRQPADGLPMRCYCGLDDCIETFLSGPGWAARSALGLTAEQLAACNA